MPMQPISMTRDWGVKVTNVTKCTILIFIAGTRHGPDNITLRYCAGV